MIDSIWDAIEEHKTVAEKVASAWKEEAKAQQSIVEECAAVETLERMQTLEVCCAWDPPPCLSAPPDPAQPLSAVINASAPKHAH